MSGEDARLIIITGASRGIGAAVARLVGARGYAVAVNFLQDERAARKVVDDIITSGGSAIPLQGNIAREEDIIRLFEEAEKTLGPVYGLVNNAGITGGFARVEQLQADNLIDALITDVAVRFSALAKRSNGCRLETRVEEAALSIFRLWPRAPGEPVNGSTMRLQRGPLTALR